jgi:hypothetical protein
MTSSSAFLSKTPGGHCLIRTFIGSEGTAAAEDCGDDSAMLIHEAPHQILIPIVGVVGVSNAAALRVPGEAARTGQC